jgi:hypothetical protein
MDELRDEVDKRVGERDEGESEVKLERLILSQCGSRGEVGSDKPCKGARYVMAARSISKRGKKIT